MAFARAQRHAAKLRMALHGPAGSGKTKTALLIASGLGSRIAVIDTENGSASRYAGEEGVPDFDVDEVRPPYLSGIVGKKIREAYEAGYDVVIVDSLTAFWKGEGGIMTVVDDVADKQAARGMKRDTFGAWKEGDRLYREMMDAIQGAPIHVIATMRSKMSYEKDESSKKIQKLGYAPEMREGAEYEFDLECSLSMEHLLAVGKTRITALDGKTIKLPGRSLGEGLSRWLDGAPPPPKLAAVHPPVQEAPPPARPTPPPASGPREAAPALSRLDAACEQARLALESAADLVSLDVAAAGVKALSLPAGEWKQRLGAAYVARKAALQAPPAEQGDAHEGPSDGR